MKTIYEVAELFGVHWQTVRNWIKEGKIRAIKIERTVRIPDEEIERLKRGGSKWKKAKSLEENRYLKK